MNNIKVKLTEKADKQLSAYLDDQKSMIIDKIIKTKRLPGDDELEITASEIIEVTQNIIYRTKSDNVRKVIKLRLFSTIYIFSGFILFFGGIFYDEIKYTFQHSPEKIAIMILGIFMSFLGLAAFFAINMIEKRSLSANVKDSAKANI